MPLYRTERQASSETCPCIWSRVLVVSMGKVPGYAVNAQHSKAATETLNNRTPRRHATKNPRERAWTLK